MQDIEKLKLFILSPANIVILEDMSRKKTAGMSLPSAAGKYIATSPKEWGTFAQMVQELTDQAKFITFAGDDPLYF